MSPSLDDLIATMASPESGHKVGRESGHTPLPTVPMPSLQRCHILVPDEPKPMGAVVYNAGYYSYVMAYTNEAAAQRGARRLLQKGNRVVLTTTPRRLILWVLEPDAKRV